VGPFAFVRNAARPANRNQIVTAVNCPPGDLGTASISSPKSKQSNAPPIAAMALEVTPKERFNVNLQSGSQYYNGERIASMSLPSEIASGGRTVD
jgi:hypothetical protein